MLFDKGTSLETIYSLPVIAHSTAISTRTPTAGYKQESKFMPDFGGTLDILGTSLKNNSLSNGLPYRPRPNFELVHCHDTCPGGSTINNDSIVASKYLETCGDKQFSTVRAIGQTLFFDFLEETRDQETSESTYITTPYAQVPYTSNLLGIKRQRNFILIKSDQGCKTILMNKSYVINHDQLSTTNEIDRRTLGQQTALDFIASINESQIRDACLNKFNNNIEAIGISHGGDNEVKLYDLSKQTRFPFQTVSWNCDGTDFTSLTIREQNYRKRVVREFEPSERIHLGIQQLDHIPSHLINMLVTTTTQTCLLDPRQENVAQTYVDKSKLSSFYPIELMKKSEFSQRNSYQFYSLTNVHLRVFDTRYHGTPMNQINHMLDSNSFDTFNLKLINYIEGNLETLCCSSTGALSLSTLDQTRIGNLINPKVVHLPHIEPSLNEFMNDQESNLLGLDVIINENKDSNGSLFLALQLSANGDIYLREFMTSHVGEEMDIDFDNQVNDILESDKRIFKISSGADADGIDLNIEALSDSEAESNIEHLNILETDVFNELENRFESKRALERFENMKNKLDT